MKRFLKILFVISLSFVSVSCVNVIRGEFWLSTNEVSVDNQGGEILVAAGSNYFFESLCLLKYGQWQIQDNYGWISSDSQSGLQCEWLTATMVTDDAENYFIRIEVAANDSGLERNARIEVNDGALNATVTVNQSK